MVLILNLKYRQPNSCFMCCLSFSWVLNLTSVFFCGGIKQRPGGAAVDTDRSGKHATYSNSSVKWPWSSHHCNTSGAFTALVLGREYVNKDHSHLCYVSTTVSFNGVRHLTWLQGFFFPLTANMMLLFILNLCFSKTTNILWSALSDPCVCEVSEVYPILRVSTC